MAFSPDGQGLATTSDDDTAKVWDLSAGKEQLTLRGRSGDSLGATWNLSGSRFRGTNPYSAKQTTDELRRGGREAVQDRKGTARRSP